MKRRSPFRYAYGQRLGPNESHRVVERLREGRERAAKRRMEQSLQKAAAEKIHREHPSRIRQLCAAAQQCTDPVEQLRLGALLRMELGEA